MLPQITTNSSLDMFFNMLHVLTTSYKYEFHRKFLPDVVGPKLESMGDQFIEEFVSDDERARFEDILRTILRK